MEASIVAAQEDRRALMAKNESELNEILKARIDSIQDEMERFNKYITSFAGKADLELLNVVGNVNLLHRNLGHASALK